MGIFFDIFFRGHSNEFKAAADRVLKIGQETGKELEHALGDKLKELLGLAAIEEGLRRTIEFGDKITDLSSRLGISTKHLQEWAYAADHSGSSIETVTTFLEHLTAARQKALEGDVETIRNWRQMGIGLDQLRSKSNIHEIAQGMFGKVKSSSPQDISPALRQLGGRGASELINTMKEFDELKTEAEEAGAILNDRILESLKAIKNEILGIGAAMRGPFAQVLDWLRHRLNDVVDLMKILTGGVGIFFDTWSKKGFAEAKTEWFKFQEWVQEERDKSEKEITGRADERQANGDMPFANTRPVPNEKQSLNSWQQLGAAVRFAEQPKQIDLLTKIEQHTNKTAEFLSNHKPEATMYQYPSFGP